MALTLRLLGGLTTERSPAPSSSRSRPSRNASSGPSARSPTRGVPFEVPRRPSCAERLASVLEVVYLIFNEGYSATAGDDWMRPELCHEALRLGRILAELTPAEPEVHGLVALMEIQASRLRARVGADGAPIRLADQNRGRWDQLLIRAASPRCCGPSGSAAPLGPYALQAAIAACHARARRPRRPTGRASPRSTRSLRPVTPSPIVELNRAVAVAMAYGPAAGLALVDALADDPHCATTTCCRACAATCSPGSVADEARAEFRGRPR